jgi:putative spermidine/putrescine transport system ATP-binding protein
MSTSLGRHGHTLTLEGITQRFGTLVAANAISLEVAAGELVALLGPSGCGKTTLLRVVAGFQRQTEGRVLFDGAPVDHLPTVRRGVGIVFQNYALFPHMTVRQNIAYGLEARGLPRAAITPKVNEMLELVRMHDLGGRLPRQLSGGQQQRIALARALAVDPKILLLDEPFGALDKNLRLDMQIEVKRLQREFGITTLLVTHDQEEAMSMADRIVVLNKGNIEQCAPPVEIYDRPATLFVNQFVGTTNLVPAEVLRADGAGVLLAVGDTQVHCESAVHSGALAPGARVTWSIRPEKLRIVADAGPGRLRATVRVVLPMGPINVYEAEVAGTSIKVNAPRDGDAPTPAAGASVYIEQADSRSGHVFAAAA